MKIQVESQYPYGVNKQEAHLLGIRVVIKDETVYVLERKDWTISVSYLYTELQGYLNCLFDLLNPPRREVDYVSREVPKFDPGDVSSLADVLVLSDITGGVEGWV